MSYSPKALYDGFFFACIGFLAGTIFASQEIPLYLPLAIGTGALLIIRKTKRRTWLYVLLCTTALFGFLHYTLDEYRYQREQKRLANETEFIGIITRVPKERAQGQSLFIALDNNQGNILAHTDQPRAHAYGERVHIHGTLTPPPKDSYGTYLAQEHVSGSIFQGKITIRAHNSGHPLLAWLFSFREHIRATLARLFTPDAYALMAAILIGDRDYLSESLTEQLSLSGTLHITALSGGHITIITFGLYAVMASLLPGRKRLSFVITFVIVALFVAMTGFVVSAVRASLMACAAHVGQLVGRNKNPRNIIALTALVLTLYDPKTPAHDVGFQLSCLATIGIIYGTPLLQRLPFFATPGIAAWRYILAATVAAQIAVFPLTTTLFQNFSFASLPANVAVVFVMPLLTIGGFVAVGAAALNEICGTLVAIPLSFLLSYTQNAVELFAAVAVPFNPRFSTSATALYYALLVWISVRWSSSEKPSSLQSLP